MHFNVTLNPTAQWVMQQLREAFSDDSVPRYLIFDNDSRPTQSQALGKHRLPAIFSDKVTEAIKRFGIGPKRTALRSPWQNGVAECWVRSCKRAVIDHVIVFNEDPLRRLLREYVSYDNAERVHTVMRDAPEGRNIEARPSLGAKGPKICSGRILMTNREGAGGLIGGRTPQGRPEGLRGQLQHVHLLAGLSHDTSGSVRPASSRIGAPALRADGAHANYRGLCTEETIRVSARIQSLPKAVTRKSAGDLDAAFLC